MLSDDRELPVQTPEYLYKFRNWGNEHHKPILTKRVIYFSPPEKLNDPFDCQIPAKWGSLPDSDFRKITTHLGREAGDEQTEIERVIRVLGTPEQLDKLEHNHLRVFRNAYAVASFSTVVDNVVLWSHYAADHKGFCVELDARKLDAFFAHKFRTTKNTNRLILIRGLWIKYTKNVPNIAPSTDPDHNLHNEMLTTKSSDWEYEKEYRFVYNRPWERLDDLKKDWEGFELPIERGIIASVRLGCQISDPDRKEIVAAVRSSEPDARVLQAKRAKDRFELEFEEL